MQLVSGFLSKPWKPGERGHGGFHTAVRDARIEDPVSLWWMGKDGWLLPSSPIFLPSSASPCVERAHGFKITDRASTERDSYSTAVHGPVEHTTFPVRNVVGISTTKRRVTDSVIP